MIKTYKIEVDGANCANLAEAGASKVSGVLQVNVNYITQKMTVTIEDGTNFHAVMKAIYKVCRRIEPDFKIYM